MIVRTTTVFCLALLVGLLAAAVSRSQTLKDARLTVKAIAAGQFVNAGRSAFDFGGYSGVADSRCSR